MKPFRFWVQTALPLVYEDSLSYYELLCKVVNYINNFMKDMVQFEGEITEYSAKVDEIQAYVNGYFSSADFRALVDEALDQMAEDGDFDAIIQPILEQMASDVNDALEDVEEITATFNGRVEALESGASDMEGDIDRIDDDIENLASAIAGESSKWELVFVSGNHIGDCFYMCHEYDTNKSEAIIFDTGDDSAATALNYSLASRNVDKVLAIVVSHWHSDHITGLTGLLNNANIDFSDCVMYKPHHYINYNRCVGEWVSYIPGMDIQFTALMENKGGSTYYPDEGERVEIGDIALVFSNLSSTKFNNYYDVFTTETLYPSDSTNYNNFSMLTSVYFGSTKLAFSADLMPEAEAQNRSFPVGAHLYKVEHHGLNVVTDNQYANGIGADISVVTDYGDRHDEAMLLKLPTVNRCAGVGALYDTKNGEVSVIISKSGVYSKSENRAIDSSIYHGSLGANCSIYDGVDFNTLVEPGVYTVYNWTRMQTMHNYPPADAGGKLVVEAVTASGYINQYFICANSQVPAVFFRCRAWEGSGDSGYYVWRNWRCLRPSVFLDRYLTSSDVNPSASLVQTWYENRVLIQNGVLTISFAANITSDIPADSAIVTIEDIPGLEGGYYTNFVAFDNDTGDMIPMYCFGDNRGGEDRFLVINYKAIAANTKLRFNVTYNIHCQYPSVTNWWSQ